MKRVLRVLLLLLLIVPVTHAATNKTFFMPRPHGVNLAMEYTTWQEMVHTKKGDRFGAHLQVTGFYQESDDRDDLGRYFGIRHKHIMKMHHATAALPYDFNWNRVRYVNGTDTDDHFTLKFEPKQKAYGARIDYYQDLGEFLQGLYAKVALPIVRVENDMRMNVYDTAGEYAAGGNLENTIENFFRGTLNANTGATAATDRLENLTYAKIYGKKSSTGVADIDVVLGYQFVDKEKYRFSANIGLTIPTGDEADGVWLFEPIVGNGNHWAFGGGFDFAATVWSKEEQALKIILAANYRFLFQDKEKRTLGLKNFGTGVGAQETDVHEFGHYRRLSNVALGQNLALPIPAANILTNDVDVEPGGHLDAILALAYNYGGFTVDFGYNLFWKEDEDVTLRSDPFFGGTYGVLYETIPSNQAALATVAHLVGDKVLTKDDLDVDAATTPSQVTHKIYGGLGYVLKKSKFLALIGIGAHYEFAANDGIDNWGIWGKIGVGF